MLGLKAESCDEAAATAAALGISSTTSTATASAASSDNNSTSKRQRGEMTDVQQQQEEEEKDFAQAPPAAAAETTEGEKRKYNTKHALPYWADPVQEGSKRARRPPPRFSETAGLDSKEEKILRQAIANSVIETRLCDEVGEILEVPTYRPTPEQFADPIRFIESIRREAEPYGVVKIIPPEGWAPPPEPLEHSFNNSKPFPTRLQSLAFFKEGTGFADGKEYNAKTYEEMAQKFSEEWIESRYRAQGKGEPSYEDLEKDYWRIIETAKESVDVEYANDLDTLTYGSGFPRAKDMMKKGGTQEGDGGEESFAIEKVGTDPVQGRVIGTPEYYERCGWNMNNLPLWPGSVLRYIRAPLKGVNVPWLYMGMLFATFCWHNEDNFMYSLNYLHKGAPKQWYTVPGSKADLMEKVMKGFLRETFQKVPDLLHHMTTIFSPLLFQRAGVPVYKARQEPGQFIVTFPKSFHAGFNYGYNCAEAVNFSPPVWLNFGREAIERYRRFARNSVFSHDRLVLTLAHNLCPEWSVASLRALLADLRSIIQEEEYRRNQLKKQGLRFNVVAKSKLLPNNLKEMNDVSLDYDEKRVCLSCRHVCFLSAVACECNGFKVACLREVSMLCECKMENRYLMAWHEMDELWGIVQKVETYIKKREAEEEKEEEKMRVLKKEEQDGGVTTGTSSEGEEERS